MNNNSISLYVKAASFAAFKHRNQKRKGQGEVPYINHPLQVADILSQAGIDDIATLCAAVLHDTIQDTQTTSQEIQNHFGKQICNIVLECSDDKNLSKDQRKRYQIEHAKHVSPKARLVKIADKLSNNEGLGVNSPKNWTKQRVQGYYIWSYAVCKNLYGANQKLDARMDKLFTDVGVKSIEEKQFNEKLKDYIESLKQSKD